MVLFFNRSIIFAFPIFIEIEKKYGAEFMLIVGAISLLLTIILNDFFHSLDVSLYVLFVGQLPVFCLGIYFASKPVIRLPNVLIVAALGIFYLGNVHEFFWYFAPVAVTFFMLAFMLLLFPVIFKVKWLNSFLLFSGSISLYLFAVHGMARFPFEHISEKYENAFITSSLSLVYLGGVYLLAWLVKQFDEKVQSKLPGQIKNNP